MAVVRYKYNSTFVSMFYYCFGVTIALLNTTNQTLYYRVIMLSGKGVVQRTIKDYLNANIGANEQD